MKQNVWLVACCSAFLAGCDYTAQLVKTPELPIDQSLIGSWSREADNGRTERLLVLPLGPAEYLVSFPAEEKNALFARACHSRTGDWKLVQLTWFGTARGAVPEDGRIYQYAVYTVKGDALTVGLLNADVVKRDAATAEALIRALDANRDSPDLFREALVFKKEQLPTDPNARLKRPPMPAGWQ